ncbi:MAG: phasin family protein, partial [Bosea sp. (in: a-proteobacteria)]
NAQDVTRKAMGFAESNIAAAFDLAQKLVRSKDLTEVMQHQSEYLKSQMAALQSQLKDMGAAAQDVAAKAADSAAKATKMK